MISTLRRTATIAFLACNRSFRALHRRSPDDAFVGIAFATGCSDRDSAVHCLLEVRKQPELRRRDEYQPPRGCRRSEFPFCREGSYRWSRAIPARTGPSSKGDSHSFARDAGEDDWHKAVSGQLSHEQIPETGFIQHILSGTVRRTHLDRRLDRSACRF
jgi:hypothetical protein